MPLYATLYAALYAAGLSSAASPCSISSGHVRPGPATQPDQRYWPLCQPRTQAPPPPLSGAGVLIQAQLPGGGAGGGRDLVTLRQQVVCLYTEADTQASPPVTHGFRTSRWVADVALMSIFMSLFCCAFLIYSRGENYRNESVCFSTGHRSA